MNKHNLSLKYVDDWWSNKTQARGRGKKVRLFSDDMSLELKRAFEAGWTAANAINTQKPKAEDSP